MSPLKAKSKADLDTRSESETTAASTEASREGEGDAGALPPAIQRAIRTLSEQGFSITAENMKHLSHKARKDAFMALQNGLRAKAPEELGKYKMVTGQDEKRGSGSRDSCSIPRAPASRGVTCSLRKQRTSRE